MPVISYPPKESVVTVSTQLNNYNSTPGCSASGTNTVTNAGQTVVSFEYSTASGRATPNWRKMRNSGRILPMTYWAQYIINGYANPGAREWCDSAGHLHRWSNYYSGIGVTTTPWLIERWDENYIYTHWAGSLDFPYVVQKAASKIYSSGFDALTFLSELKQLRRMLSGVVDKLVRLCRGKSIGALESLWLEGRYGWRTLLYDIQDLAQALKRENARRSRFREQAGLKTSGSWEDVSQSTSSNITTEVVTNYSWELNQRGTVVADIEIPDFQFNPITTAWELTRLSFVFDWLVNVGQALNSASFLLLAKDYKSCAGYKTEVDIDGDISLVSKGSNISATVSGSWYGHASFVLRSPYPVSIKPQVRLRLDEFKVLDILALLLQSIKR